MNEVKRLVAKMVKNRKHRREILAAMMLPDLYARRHQYGMGTTPPKGFVKMALSLAKEITG